MPDLVPRAQAATEFDVSQASLYAYLKAGRLKRYKRAMDRRTYGAERAGAAVKAASRQGNVISNGNPQATPMEEHDLIRRGNGLARCRPTR